MFTVDLTKRHIELISTYTAEWQVAREQQLNPKRQYTSIRRSYSSKQKQSNEAASRGLIRSTT